MNKEAITHYQNALELQLQDGPRAVEEFSRAIELEPSFTDAYIRRGTLKYKVLKLYKDALADLNKAVLLGPPTALAFLHRAIIKCHLLKFNDALPDFNQSILLDPYDERAYFNRGKLKFMLNHPKEDITSDLQNSLLLGFAPAAELLQTFYGKNPSQIRQSLDLAVKEKAKLINK